MGFYATDNMDTAESVVQEANCAVLISVPTDSLYERTTFYLLLKLLRLLHDSFLHVFTIYYDEHTMRFIFATDMTIMQRYVFNESHASKKHL